MGEQFQCQFKECKSRALLIAYNKMLCGEHFMKIKNSIDEMINKSIEQMENTQ